MGEWGCPQTGALNETGCLWNICPLRDSLSSTVFTGMPDPFNTSFIISAIPRYNVRTYHVLARNLQRVIFIGSNVVRSNVTDDRIFEICECRWRLCKSGDCRHA